MNNILIIEDSESYQFLAEVIVLECYPTANIYKAYDGIEALDLINSQNLIPDAILLDINMPRMDGHGFLAEYAKIHNGKVPVVAMLTSSDQEQDKELVKQYHFVKDYVVKPLDASHLLKLQEIIDNS